MLKLVLVSVITGLLLTIGIAPVQAMPGTAPSTIVSKSPSVVINGTPEGMLISPDGKTGYIQMTAPSLRIQVVSLVGTPVATKSIPLEGTTRKILALSPDGQRLYISADGSRPFKVLNLASTQYEDLIGDTSGSKFPRSLSAMSISPDGKKLLTGSSDGVISVYSLKDLSLLYSAKVDSEIAANAMAIAADSKTAFVATYWGSKVIKIDLDAQKITDTISLPDCSYVKRIYLNTKTAAITCQYGDIALVDLATYQPRTQMELDFGYEINDATLSRDGARLLVATSGYFSKVVEFDLGTGAMGASMELGGQVTTLASDPTSNRVHATFTTDTDTRLTSFESNNKLPSQGIDRIYGADRYATSAAISQASKPSMNLEANGIESLYLATGEQFADALSAAPVATAAGAPLLLTKTAVLPDVVRAEIARLKPQKIVIVGGTGAVSEGVAKQLKTLSPKVVRISGADRYATSRALAESSSASSGIVYIATAEDYPDALSAGSAASRSESKLILVRGRANGLDAATKTTLRKLKVKISFIAGGTGVVSQGIQKDLVSILGAWAVSRHGGKDRFATSQSLMKRFAPYSYRSYFVDAYSFPDALVASTAQNGIEGVVSLVRPTCIPAPVLDYSKGTSLERRITMVGGPMLLGPSVEAGKSC